MAELYIDAENAIVGRLGAYVCKRALLGDTIKIMNSEKALFSGSKKGIIERYATRRKYLGTPVKGPYYSRLPDRFLKRVIRGMLPYKRERGKNAFDRIMCYVGVPDEFKKQKLIKIKQADASKLRSLKRAYVQEVCKALCAK